MKAYFGWPRGAYRAHRDFDSVGLRVSHASGDYALKTWAEREHSSRTELRNTIMAVTVPTGITLLLLEGVMVDSPLLAQMQALTDETVPDQNVECRYQGLISILTFSRTTGFLFGRCSGSPTPISWPRRSWSGHGRPTSTTARGQRASA